MTIKEISKQLCELSILINGETPARSWVESYIKRMFRIGSLAVPDKLLMRVLLDDGEWFCVVSRFSASSDGFDYEIPDTKEQEEKLIAEWFKK